MSNSKIKIGVWGLNFWVNSFKECFKNDENIEIYVISKFSELVHLSNHIDLFYVIFGWLDKVHIFSVLYLSLFRKPIVIHWVGTDVLRVINPQTLNLKRRIKRCFLLSFFRIYKRCYHIAGAPWLKEELKLVGIEAKFIPVVSPMIKEDTPIYPFPDTLTILSYIPLGREDFYGEEKLLQIARRNPDIKFIVVANSPDRKPKDLDNCEYLGWVSRDKMEELYKEATCVMRLTKHDGLSGLGMEALLRGRYLIFTYKHPFVNKAGTVEEIQKALDEIKLKKTPNYEGAQYVKENYSMEKVKSDLENFFLKILYY